MTFEELEEEIAVELEALESTVNELLSLQGDVADREPTVRETTAAAAFLAQFYNGVENILKRISRYHNVAIPSGETWHVDLFQRYCSPLKPELPTLLDKAMSSALIKIHPRYPTFFRSIKNQISDNRFNEYMPSNPLDNSGTLLTDLTF